MAYDPRFRRSTIDTCLYYIIDWPDTVVFVLVQVDDYACATNSSSFYNGFRDAYDARFGIDDLGSLNHIMQAKVTFVPGGVEVSQQRHIDNLALAHDSAGLKGKATPMAELIDLQRSDVVPSNLPYRSIVMSIMWIARFSRPEVMHDMITLTL